MVKNKDICKWFKKSRLDLGLTVRSMSDILGYGDKSSYVYQIETHFYMPSKHVITSLERYLELYKLDPKIVVKKIIDNVNNWFNETIVSMNLTPHEVSKALNLKLWGHLYIVRIRQGKDKPSDLLVRCMQHYYLLEQYKK